jgi:hypothetical protein
MAYNNVVGIRRASWGIVSLIKGKEHLRGNEEVTMIKEKIESELAKICDILHVICRQVSFASLLLVLFI